MFFWKSLEEKDRVRICNTGGGSTLSNEIIKIHQCSKKDLNLQEVHDEE